MMRTISMLAATAAIMLAGSAWAGELGDCNGDGVINEADLELALGASGTGEGDPGYIPEADMDGDGAISARDLGDLLHLVRG